MPFLYHFLLRGESLRLTDEAGEILLCGLFRNEYVLALNYERAKAKAISQLKRRLAQKTEVDVDFNEFELAVEEANYTWAYWKLVRPESFIFYPIDSYNDD